MLSDMIRLRFDAVVQGTVPDQLSNLVERIRVRGEDESNQDQRRKAPEGQHQAKAMQQPPFVTCPFCLGIGERPGRMLHSTQFSAHGAGTRLP
jgi:hypothetical protein